MNLRSKTEDKFNPTTIQVTIESEAGLHLLWAMANQPLNQLKDFSTRPDLVDKQGNNKMKFFTEVDKYMP